MTETKTPEVASSNFIETEINADIANNVYTDNRVHTRFPPEPNGYLHIGHAKSICLNFGLGEKYQGKTNLRFDDTNPTKEDVEYVESIEEDVRWLGFHWDGEVHFASDYFPQMYEYAVQLIREGKAYVDDLSGDEIREYRGDFNTPGKESPYRNRPIEESLRLFEEMKAGRYADGEKVLRAKIDMASPNLVMRDPVLYRILHVPHHRTGDTWCIYPMYDFAHPVSDAIERITHSVCTLEFEAHRPLYNWVLESWPDPEHPRQIEFARLNVTTMITSKRKLRRLVEEHIVSGWDDPRMPTISGIRRRGYTPEALRDFCDRIGVAKNDSLVDISLLEFCIREDLKNKAPRLMTVLDPLKITLVNYPEGQTEELPIANNQDAPDMGERMVPFSRELYIERADFMEEPVKKFFRLAPGREVRLRNAYIIRCEEVVKDENGEIIELKCTYDPDSKSGSPGSNRKVKGVVHWVERHTAVPVEARLYDYLFPEDDTDDGRDFVEKANPDSLVVKQAVAEPAILDYPVGTRFQFMRQGYFVIDPDTTEEHLVVNRIVGLRDTWAKLQKQKEKEKQAK
ncbi:MAG: glutamine--tRNA ligase/YqeY domain fusion protein [Negativicoccus succinicivorans]|uniref:Glutamine--tRNA ligase n=1 Tax=Negativicoccus succinicivorans DORA_17_25 TaxID=1403945 RepID=W1U5E9_9FIRM|nr:glutamine--tRNA ligase/YqeY domain fusion protein [Negativicoccus succinicivorans]ETI88921.1 MAG: Glutamine-tRNA ligase [Negativicoccus succinicivorans DORA_17_25]MBS5917410.1 glutamine--tRNA ligase/YqeY domain fusion protein [Negativicoccus succinicivorans]MDU2643977.1 glutamine--tRNA ligase/YqeY domain fusion protein [Negativicoccus succinicivorans]MDU2929601.1 glutamine--tRNA ligase/YqeY domain fusion protein [Negativicoccus succinicivorans]MDU4202992.1 glutamine--tRNA ligase/YqeY domain